MVQPLNIFFQGTHTYFDVMYFSVIQCLQGGLDLGACQYFTCPFRIFC